MGYPTKIQMIKRGKNRQWLVNFPAALASAIELAKSETVEWIVVDKNKMELVRNEKKKKSEKSG